MSSLFLSRGERLALAHRRLRRRSGGTVAETFARSPRSGLRRRPASGHRRRATHRRSHVEALDASSQRAVSRMITAAKIVVVDNQIEPALKALKKQMQKAACFKR